MSALTGLIIGVCLYAALNHILVGGRGERRAAHLAMAAFALTAAFYVTCSTVLFSTTELETYRTWARWQGMAGPLVVIAGFAFAHTVLGGWNRRLLFTLSTALLALSGVSLMLPAGIFYGHVTDLQRVDGGILGPLTLPRGTANPVQALFNTLTYLPMLFVLVRALRVFRSGQRRLASLTAIAVLLPTLPALIDTFVLGAGTYPAPVTEIGLALALIFLSVVVSEEVARSAGLRETLEASVARHRWLVETAPEAIGLYDVEQDRFVLVNGRTEVLFGRSAADLTSRAGMELIELTSDDSAAADAVRALIARALAGEAPVAPWWVKRPDGSRVPCELRVSLLPDSSGQLLRASLLDVSDRIAAEAQQAELAARMEHSEKLQTLGALAHGVAHNFNNILTPLVALGELAAEQLEGHPAAAYLAEMRSSADRARDLVRQIITSRTNGKAGQQSVLIEPIVRQAVRFLRAALPPTIELEVRLHAGDARVPADPTRVHQIVLNLGLNAAHAMQQRGTLRVTLTTDEQRVELSVRDHGHGMDPETASHIFDPFFTTKQPGEGTGLGLSIVRDIVRSWNGDIRVRTAPGEGAEFTVSLPRLPQTEALVGTAVGLRRGAETVLLVDDDRDALEAVRRMLLSLGHLVLAHADPEEALRTLQPGAIAVCITDYEMPHLNGGQLAERLRLVLPGLPIILMSGSVEVLQDWAASDASCTILPKPFGRAELSAALRAVLDHEPDGAGPLLIRVTAGEGSGAA